MATAQTTQSLGCCFPADDVATVQGHSALVAHLGMRMSGAAYYLKFDEIVDVIGQECDETLIGHLGGTRFYVREKLPPGHRIVLAIGVEAGEKFAAYIATGIGGLAVELPTHRSGKLASYRKHLRDVVAKSDPSEAALAAELGVHGRTIRTPSASG